MYILAGERGHNNVDIVFPTDTSFCNFIAFMLSYPYRPLSIMYDLVNAYNRKELSSPAMASWKVGSSVD